MENFHPLCQAPYHANVPNSGHHCAEFAQDCAELKAQKFAKIIVSALGKYFDVQFLAT